MPKEPKEKKKRSAIDRVFLAKMCVITAILTPVLYMAVFRRLLHGPEVAMSQSICFSFALLFAKNINAYVDKYRIEHVEKGMLSTAIMLFTCTAANLVCTHSENQICSLLPVLSILGGLGSVRGELCPQSEKSYQPPPKKKR